MMGKKHDDKLQELTAEYERKCVKSAVKVIADYMKHDANFAKMLAHRSYDEIEQLAALIVRHMEQFVIELDAFKKAGLDFRGGVLHQVSDVKQEEQDGQNRVEEPATAAETGASGSAETGR